MSNEPTRTDFRPEGFVSENAVRAGNGVPAESAPAGKDTPALADGARRLRRWSVAGLIAHAGAARPSTS